MKKIGLFIWLGLLVSFGACHTRYPKFYEHNAAYYKHDSMHYQYGKQIPPEDGMLEKWELHTDSIVYSKILIAQNDSSIFRKSYVINLSDSSFIWQGKKIFMFNQTPNAAYFDNLEAYFDEYLPPMEPNIEWTIWLTAIVEPDGNIQHVGVNSRYGGLLRQYNYAALNIIKKMPKWKPAQYNNKNVASLVKLKVKFKVK